MKSRSSRRLAVAGLLALCYLVLSHALSEAVAPPALPDLTGFKTVETAATTKTSAPAPPAPRQPAYLGIAVEAREGALVIIDIESGSPAFRAGLEIDDLLRSVDGKQVADAHGLAELVRARAPGDELKVALTRSGKTMHLTVALTAVSRPLTPGQRVVLGVQIEPDSDGVKVTAVSDGMPAARAGIKIGDIIAKLNGNPVTPETLPQQLLNYRPGDEVRVSLLRDGKPQELKAQLTAAERNNPRGGRGWDSRTNGLFRKPVYRLAVLPIEFSDVKHNDAVLVADWEKALFSTHVYTDKSPTGQRVYGSLNDFYLEQSCGAFRVEGKVFDWIKVKEKRNDYGNNNNRSALLDEALNILQDRNGVDVLKGFDGIFFLYAGGRARSNRGGLFWPHKSTFQHKGSRWSYFICPEMSGRDGKAMASISVMTHEFGHMLGLPDLYAAPENPGSEGLGVWCTMSTGHGEAGKPLHFSAWCKEQLGWLKPAVIDPRKQQKLLLAPIEDSAKECYKVLLAPDGSEYLLLENRVRRKFDADLPAEGLLIWRVVNGRPVLEESHGITTPDGPNRFLGSIPYPSSSNNAFTPFTTPSSKGVKSNAIPVYVTNIRRLADGRISFLIGYEFQ
jgi:M6 family metalloprotease-like protein